MGKFGVPDKNAIASRIIHFNGKFEVWGYGNYYSESQGHDLHVKGW